MNPKDFFEVHHYRLIEPTESVPSLVSDNTKALNNKTVTLSSLKQQKKQLLSAAKQVQEPIYYLFNEDVWQIGKKESQQTLFFVGDLVRLLCVIRYKGMYEIDSLHLEGILEQRKRPQNSKILRKGKFEVIKENDELTLFNEFKIDEQDEYFVSYHLSYRQKAIGQMNNSNQEEYRVDKKNQLIFKAYLPFESHYSMVTDNFPVIYLEYQLSNISGQKLDLKQVDFRVDKCMETEKLSLHGDKDLVQDNFEEYRQINIITDITSEKQNNNYIEYIQEDGVEFDMKLGQIYLEWNFCGQYLGSQKVCLVKIYPTTLKIVEDQFKRIEKERITKIQMELILGQLFPVEGGDIQIRLDDNEMKLVKVVGFNLMKFTFDRFIRSATIELDVISLICGIHTIRGIKLIDPSTQKVIAYRNQLTIIVVNQSNEVDEKQEKKVITQADLLEEFHVDLGVQKTQQSQQQEEVSLL